MAPPAPLYPKIEGGKEKYCTRCGVPKPVAEFDVRLEMDGGRSSHCKSCKNLTTRRWKTHNSGRVSSQIGTKTCRVCGDTKNVTLFEPNSYCKDGRHTTCKVCRKKQRHKWSENNRDQERETKRRNPNRKIHIQKWQQQNKEYLRGYMKTWKANNPGYERQKTIEKRFRNYGATQDWYDQKLKTQNFACAICSSTDPKSNGNTFHIDHDHSCCSKSCTACDKCRRGLLCSVCNTRLGILENKVWTAKAQAYLLLYGSNRTS